MNMILKFLILLLGAGGVLKGITDDCQSDALRGWLWAILMGFIYAILFIL